MARKQQQQKPPRSAPIVTTRRSGRASKPTAAMTTVERGMAHIERAAMNPTKPAARRRGR